MCSKVDILSREVYFEIVEDKYILEEKERAKKIQEEKLENIKRELNSESLKEDDI